MTTESLEILLAVTLFLVSAACWILNVIGLPGNWLIVLLAALYKFVPTETRVELGWSTLTGLIVLAVIGELIEFAASALGASRAGGSRRGAILAMIGSIAGGIVGIFAGGIIPIPVVGLVIGGLLFAGLGALVGAVLGEQWKGRELGESIRIGHAAFWGRILGTLGKITAGAAMLLLLLASLVF